MSAPLPIFDDGGDVSVNRNAGRPDISSSVVVNPVLEGQAAVTDRDENEATRFISHSLESESELDP